jgi:hypothetical protein
MRLSKALFLLPLLAACSDVKEDDHDHHHDHNHGLTTALVLDFTSSGGDTLTFTWEDPTADGSNVKIDDVELTAGETYDLNLTVLNQLEDPVEDVTVEIIEGAEEHQFFFTGSAVVGPASDSAGAVLQHAYNDVDANGLPIGLDNLVTALDAGEGELTVTLRHMPPEGDQAVKTADLASEVLSGGFSAIGGDNDIQVTFPVLTN